MVWTFNKKYNVLMQEVASLNKKIDDLTDSFDRAVKYQNSVNVALSTYASSDDKIFDIYQNATNIRFYLPNGNSDSIQREIIRTSSFYQGGMLSKVFSRVKLKENPVIVDVGANIGNHTLYFSKVLDASKVYSFEPNYNTFSVLLKNIEINSLESVVSAFQSGVGSKKTMARNTGHKITNSGGNKVMEDENGDIEIVRLDDLSLGEVDFLKVDVEGNGGSVVSGGLRLIEKLRPVILMEASSEDEKSAVRMLKNDLGYRIRERFGEDVLLTP